MKQIILNRYLLLIARLVLGLVFIFAGIEKIVAPSEFAVSIENYRLFPLFSINILAIIVPWIELLSGTLLIFGIAIKENTAIINTFLILFIILIVSALMRNLDIECGCFGTANAQKVGLMKILENLGMLVLGLVIFLYDHNPIRLLKQRAENE
jgi:uncharacterized membrane protein YphA (DoxX/SURF4 family)